MLCFSPVGETFRKRIRTFPGLVNCTTIDWFLPWPAEALKSTAETNIKEIKEIKDEAVIEGLVNLCADMQLRVEEKTRDYLIRLKRYYYVTPTSYLDLLNTIKVLHH